MVNMKKILFVSTTGRNKRPYFDPSVRYRCYNLAEELSKLGHYTKVTTSHEFITNESEDLLNFDIYIFHRPPFSAEFLSKVNLLKKENKTLIADFDDLTFDVENALNSSLYKTGRASEREVLNIFSKNSAALSVFQNYTVSTESLKSRILELKPDSNVEVIHNSLTEKYKAICDQIRNNEKIERIKGRIGYFSGTKSHDKDIEYISEALVDVCNNNSNTELFFVGPVTIPDIVKEKCKTTSHNLVGYHEMIKLLFTCEVIIAPLEETFFNNCKSSLKYFESAYAGCNVVATPIVDFHRFETENLYLASNVEDWKNNLTSALRDFSEQDETSRITYASKNASIKNEINTWLKFISEI